MHIAHVAASRMHNLPALAAITMQSSKCFAMWFEGQMFE